MPRDFRRVSASLEDMLGRDYVAAVISARAALTGEPAPELRRLARRKVDFLPAAMQHRMVELLPQVGRRVGRKMAEPPAGASTRMFDAASAREKSPAAGWGYYRVGEDGRLYFMSKSEHYHVPLGHGFPGYRLVDYARRLGIPNATHNNTRGHITRLLERELVRTANGLEPGDSAGLGKVLRSRGGSKLNRVLNLQTGSLAVEAGIKMMLARFYRIQEGHPPPRYAGRTPVFLVVGDEEGHPRANYHGTTILTQAMRGMWPELRNGLERHKLLRIAPVRPNDTEALADIFREYDRGPNKIAGFCHELVLMNYGGLRLTQRFMESAYSLCRKHDVPVLADEIQSCLWSPELYMVREHDLSPTFLVIGKGFPGGEYAASRILFNSHMDCLPQFGALVTNGQEELASLAYLVTMRWAEENADATRETGDRYWSLLRELGDRFRQHIAGIQGCRHLAAICFRRLDTAKAFVAGLADGGIDISVQTYKPDCPPAAMTKLPLIAGRDATDMLADRMGKVLEQL